MLASVDWLCDGDFDGRGSPVDNSDAKSDSGFGYRRGRRDSSDSRDEPPNFRASGDGGASRKPRQRPAREKTEICMYFIKGHCKHEDRCFKAHDKMPYRWQVNVGGVWNALPENEAIEKDYCDPKNSYSTSSPPVHFDTMTRGDEKVRRLSTVNSLVEPTFIHTTEWLWYWQDEFGKWNLYAADSAGHRTADTDSAKLEQKFLDDDKGVVEFTAGSQLYSLSFQDMMQTNKRYGTAKVVCRRPRFVSAEEARARKARRPPLNPSALPDHWNPAQVPLTGFTRVPLDPTSGEFQEVKALFSRTMPGYKVKVERIQNKALWEVFQLQKNQMKTKNGGRDVTEKKLFHGTDPQYVDAICRDNFDWRICGTHGTVYGRGSYFARDAKYSHGYCGDSILKSMFLSRVLVGQYTRGSSSYLRPPSKDGGDVDFYDSCVDNALDPSIFVVFEKHQIYPEYLLQYKKEDPLAGDDLFGDMVAAGRQVVAPKPRMVGTQSPAVTSRFQPAATASAQPSWPPQPVSPRRVSPPPRIPSSYHIPSSSSSSSSSFSSVSGSSGYPSITPNPASRYNPNRTSPPPRTPDDRSPDKCVIA